MEANRAIFSKDRLNPFYQGYLDLFEDTTDAPAEFMFTSLLPALGALISLKRWIVWGTKKIYPNMWIILVAPSTHQRKSTALNIGLYFNTLLQQNNADRKLILPNDGSISSLLTILGEEKQGVIKHSELASLLDNMSKGFNSNMKSLMTDFFDVPPVHNVSLKKEGDIRVEKPIFSMATASTINWLKQKTSVNDVESGFLARFLLCSRDNKQRSIPIPQAPDQGIRDNMLAAFETLLSLEPSEIICDEGFNQVFRAHYERIDNLYTDVLIDEGTKALFGRLQTDYFLKFSILECVLTKKRIADVEVANRASYLIDYYLGQARCVMDKIQRTKRSTQEEKVLYFLSQKPGATKTDIYGLFHKNIYADNLSSVLNSLLDANLIEKEKTGKTERFYVFGKIRNSQEHIST
ncbi:MAG: hypothetical protein PHX79_05475 [Sphaerochaetaceae bacterium]|nr:hypothetical protein [Sphaerochaetaceae bacterium]